MLQAGNPARQIWASLYMIKMTEAIGNFPILVDIGTRLPYYMTDRSVKMFEDKNTDNILIKIS